MDKRKGIMVSIHPDTGKLYASEWTLPVETHMATLAWGLDMIRAINERNPFWKWLLRIALGKYAYRELVGLRDCIEKDGYDTTYDYDLKNISYHKDKVTL